MTNTTTKTAPERIWLQVDCDATISVDGAIDGQDEPFSDDGVSWCSESVGGLEVEYIRADLSAGASQLLKAASAALHYMRLHKYADQSWADDLEAAIAAADVRN